MDGLLNIFAVAGGGLLGVAVFVACWEHWRQGAHQPLPPASAPSHPVSVDVDVDALPQEPVGDGHQRRATLDAALDRMVSGPPDPAAPPGGGWVETRPMVAPPALAEPERH